MRSLYDRFFKGSSSSYFLFGPRGTGKSTWVRKHYPNALWLDLLDPGEQRRLNAYPERLKEKVLAEPGKKVVVIDEVQRVPEVLTVVHQLIEEKQEIQFILTGSSARKLKRTGVDLLAGRALMLSMHPLMASEMNPHFSLKTALLKGLLPMVVDSDDPDRTLDAYATTYLQEEVQAEGLVRNIGNFSRFLEAISFSHASMLNISNVARESEIERKVVGSYVTILEDLLLSFRLSPFTKRAKRQSVTHSKFYLFDAGIFRSLRPQGPLDRPEEIGGLCLEGLVAQHLRAWIAYSNKKAALYYWRTRKGVEVDFIVYGSDLFIALEVKNSSRVDNNDVRSLRTFQTDYPECQACLLYRGKERVIVNNILCMPVEEFLLQLYPDQDILPK